jgi:trimethylamine--corrinoid protein Co-methyltransferase
MKPLTVLTKQEVEGIHQATLRILEETGVRLNQTEGRDILTGAGARVEGDRILLPGTLVERELNKCPRQVTICGRDGESKVLGDGSLNWHNLGGARDVYDPSTGKRRGALISDVRDSTRLLDALENATTITPFFTPQDVPGELMSLSMYRHALGGTTKPLHGPGVQTSAEVCYAVRLAEVIGAPRQILSLSVSPVSPLFFPDDVVEAIIAIARLGIAFAPLPCPTAGTTAPFSLAGALTQQNAEVLASVVLAQLVQPGLPIVYCGRLAMMEPRTGISVWGGVEMGLASAGTVQIGHHYGLPVNVYGFSTNSHVLDIQSGFERGLNAAIPALAGADELSGIGEMEAGVMGSYAQMVCDDEMAGSVKRLRRGISAEEQALAVEVVADVMRGSHNFLGQKHTRQYLHSGEIQLTQLAERGTWEGWERSDRANMAERAQAEAERLLKEHQVPALEAEQDKELNTIMLSAERELVPS